MTSAHLVSNSAHCLLGPARPLHPGGGCEDVLCEQGAPRLVALSEKNASRCCSDIQPIQTNVMRDSGISNCLQQSLYNTEWKTQVKGTFMFSLTAPILQGETVPACIRPLHKERNFTCWTPTYFRQPCVDTSKHATTT